jgi:hypothetical protein
MNIDKFKENCLYKFRRLESNTKKFDRMLQKKNTHNADKMENLVF